MKTVAVIGMGYVGMPLAVAFCKKHNVIGFDTNSKKIAVYRSGQDPTGEVGEDAIKNTKIHFTDNPEDLSQASIYIIAVPTPVKMDETPDLSPIVGATELVARYLKKGDVVIYESTVYPGVTEEICAKILWEISNLTYGIDFFVGYSPERINPGDKRHRLNNIVKIVSACNKETLENIASLYLEICEAGVYRASSIKVAEAAKLLENTQRDVNIAFMNEMAMAFDMMDIDSSEVLNAMNTKWNALGFHPGLVGGHCIGVDPYYFIYNTKQLGFRSMLITGARAINNEMSSFIVNAAVKLMTRCGFVFTNTKVYILGATFKENCPDMRNSKVEDIVKHLRSYGIEPLVCDPKASREELRAVYGENTVELSDISGADCIFTVVPHEEFRAVSLKRLSSMYRSGAQKVLIDLHSIYDIKDLQSENFLFWRL